MRDRASESGTVEAENVRVKNSTNLGGGERMGKDKREKKVINAQ